MAKEFHVKGSMVALITPFNEDGSINYDKYVDLLEFQIENKTDAILALGTTSEAPTFTEAEEDKLVEIAVEVCKGRVPVIANGGSNCTQFSCDKSRKYSDMGVDALLCISPYYNKANKRGLYTHIADAAACVDTPIIIYNIPGRTGVNIPIDVMSELAKIKNVCGVKEATGDLGYVAKIRKATENEDFLIWSGNDDVTVPIMSIGGAGTISVWANLMPAKVREMTHAFLDGNTDLAAKIQLEYLNLINDFFIEVNPIPIKEAMNLAGMNVGGYRKPLCGMTDENKAILAAEMKKLGLI
ncbi:MAG: 4-hydroxy-tetrahydrodipicolinate synthase [Firmicutes bacterium]|nr:4-hydroxy-tetrahydrodipicolinate synthase [Bacillota bacterium]